GLSEKGGAGLGLIEIARRSGGKLSYSFKPLNEELSYFYFKSKIATEPDSEEISSLNGVKELHQLAKENYISMVYQGLFTHDNLKSLLIMTEGSVARTEVAFKRKAVNVMVELLQNICNHGSAIVPDSQGIPGILVVTTNLEGCTVMSGNYISNDKLERLQTKIDRINICEENELEEIYMEEIMKEHVPGQKGAGLGFIDMRMKSSNKIDYSIIDFDANFSFLSVSVSIPF
ncbi:MAG TPA: SiaB family protein kinase, partial [Cytophaga sp.]|nr:SiaB family protein kinase [Cytophaga sp.]